MPSRHINVFGRPPKGRAGTIDENVDTFGFGHDALEKRFYLCDVFQIEREGSDYFAGIRLNLLFGSVKLLLRASNDCDVGSMLGQKPLAGEIMLGCLQHVLLCHLFNFFRLLGHLRGELSYIVAYRRLHRDGLLGDFIEDQTVHSPVDSATTSGLKETTHSVLAGLTPREAKVLRMRFGIDMNTDHTLEEVGKQFDVTRERIRQIEAKALRKLRHPTRSDQLRSFLLED